MVGNCGRSLSGLRVAVGSLALAGALGGASRLSGADGAASAPATWQATRVLPVATWQTTGVLPAALGLSVASPGQSAVLSVPTPVKLQEVGVCPHKKVTVAVGQGKLLDFKDDVVQEVRTSNRACMAEKFGGTSDLHWVSVVGLRPGRSTLFVAVSADGKSRVEMYEVHVLGSGCSCTSGSAPSVVVRP